MLRTQQELKDWQQRYHDYSASLENIDTSVSPSVDREVIQAELKRSEAKISELFERLHLYQSSKSFKSDVRKHTKRNTKRIDVAQLRLQLTPGQLLLVDFLYKGKIVIFAVTTVDVISHEIQNGAEQLERLLPLLKEQEVVFSTSKLRR